MIGKRSILAAIEAEDAVVDHFDCSRHLEATLLGLARSSMDALESGRSEFMPPVVAAPVRWQYS
jgi:hypothetical protein